jgi:excisionase family DNA binding protein
MATALFGRYTNGTRDAVYRMAKNKQIASVRDGRKWWIPASEIDRLRNLTADEMIKSE